MLRQAQQLGFVTIILEINTGLLKIQYEKSAP